MKKQVNYKVDGEKWEEAKDRAFAKLVKKAKVDGFREGKVPRNVFEKKYGTGEIISTAMEELVDSKYRDVIINEKIIPILEPKLDIVKADDEGFEVNMTFIVDPEVTLGKYKELKVKKDTVKVTKDEIEHELEHVLDHYAELVSKEGKVENGNTVIIDFKGFKDNEEFEGGSANNYSLEIGSHSFIPGFEEGIIGMKKGESKDINLTFPKDYMAKDLAGSDVVFNVTVHDIKERVVPELTEDFFKDLDMEGVTNKEELEKALEKEIREHKEHHADEKFIDDLLKKAADNMTIDLDKEIIDAERDAIYDDFAKRLSGQGISEELYFAYTKTSKEKVLEDMAKEAELRLKYRYLLEAIVKEEKIEVSDKEAKEELKKMADEYKMTEEELLKEVRSLEALKYNLRMEKAIQVLKENN